MMKRRLKDRIKRLFRSVFLAGQQAGITVLPYHFYSQIPNISELRRDDYWKKPQRMTGVDGMELDSQLAFLEKIREKAFPGASKEMYAEAVQINGEGGGYGLIEAEVLYAFIRSQRPARIVQVGCGVSTAVMLAAARDGKI